MEIKNKKPLKKQKIIGVKIIKKESDLMPILKEGIDGVNQKPLKNHSHPEQAVR